MRKKQPTLPGVEMREAPMPVLTELGHMPQVRRCVLDTAPPSAHLKDSWGTVLCGLKKREMTSKSLGEGICEQCRVEASRLRAVVR